MEIRKVDVSLLNPAAYNPRKDLQPEDAEYQALKNSMDEYGYIDPIVWNERTGNVVGGHQRLKILIEQGYREVEVSVVDYDEVKEKACNTVLNKLHGEWDVDKLAIVLEDLVVVNNIEPELIAFTDEELKQHLSFIDFQPGIPEEQGDLSTFSERPAPKLIKCPLCNGIFEKAR